VVSTTTTAVWEPSGQVVVEADEMTLLTTVAGRVRPGLALTVAAARRLVADPVEGGERSKLQGVELHAPALLCALPGVDHVLVEADGARGRSIKAPAEHEPVIPPAATHVLAVVGIDALGEPLDEAIAHRPERIAQLLRLALGTPLGPRHIADLLAHPLGGRKGAPAAARFLPVINKVHDEAALRGARVIAGLLRGRQGIAGVLITAALAPQPLLEMW
jgi:molybdenum cofactor cytidylyltransferase